MSDPNQKWTLKRLYRRHKPSGGALILRIVIGLLFVASGWYKVTHIHDVVGFFAMGGFTSFEAYLVSFTELIGGTLLILGLLTKPVCVALGTIMAVVVFGTPKAPSAIYFGHDYEFVLLGSLLALYVMGPGKYSLAHLWLTKKYGAQGK